MGEVTTREEWMVVGDPGLGFPSYEFVFGSPLRLALGHDKAPEFAAREFVRMAEDWADGPHLYSRRITETSWRKEQ